MCIISRKQVEYRPGSGSTSVARAYGWRFYAYAILATGGDPGRAKARSAEMTFVQYTTTVTVRGFGGVWTIDGGGVSCVPHSQTVGHMALSIYT